MSEYAELRRLVLEAGLRERQPAYYACQVLFVLACYTIGVVLLISGPGGWQSWLGPVVLAFAFAQVAFLGHDASHHQIFARRASKDAFCLVVQSAHRL